MPRIRLSNELLDLIRTLHPHIKKRVRAAFGMLMESPQSGKSLKKELEGLRSLRIGRIRIIYRIAEKGDIEIINIGPRNTIYRETYRLMSRKEKG